MQQIYRRTPRPKYGFNKVALQLFGTHTSTWVFSCKFAAHFKNTFFFEHLWTAASDHRRIKHRKSGRTKLDHRLVLEYRILKH